jgi:hypothetical protein
VSVGRFVDVEGLVVDWLVEQVPDVRIVTKLPENIDGIEVVRVTRSPGTNDQMRSLPRVDLESFAPSRAAMWILAGRVNDAMARLSGDEVGGTQVDTVNTVTDPVPGWWSPTVERAVAVYELDLRVIG